MKRRMCGCTGSLPTVSLWRQFSTVLLISTAMIAGGCSGPLSLRGHRGMSQRALESHIYDLVNDFSGSPGVVQFRYEGIPMSCISDTTHDRVRILASIVPLNRLTGRHLQIMLDANFHLTLDGRYATSNGMVYALYVHPLTSLSKDQIASALSQIANLVRSFGTGYNSGQLFFNQ